MTYSFKQHLLVESTLSEAMKMLKSTTIVIDSSTKGFEDLKDKVLGIKNDNTNVEEMISILGVPKDGTPIRIRTGFMRYDSDRGILFFAKFKNDLMTKG